MKSRISLIKYGLLGGGILAGSFMIFGAIWGSDPEKMNFEYGEFIGYLTMILALSTVFFGVKSYRDKKRHGLISFKDAFLNGLIIVTVASVVYVIGWVVYYTNFMPDFADNYMAFQKEKLLEQGLPEAQLKEKIEALENFNRMYKNPLIMIGISFLEVFPIGLLIDLLSAFVLKRSSLDK